MATITVLENHPEGLALAAFELGASRTASARAMTRRIGTDGCRPDTARRKLAAKAAREAADLLTSAAVLLEAGL